MHSPQVCFQFLEIGNTNKERNVVALALEYEIVPRIGGRAMPLLISVQLAYFHV